MIQTDPNYYLDYFFSGNIHKKVKNRSKMVFFHVFLPVSDYVSKISSPKATISRAVGPFTTNDGPKALQCTFRRYFVAEGDEIKGRTPVHYERRAEGPFV